jgi:hypothetical protein
LTKIQHYSDSESYVIVPVLVKNDSMVVFNSDNIEEAKEFKFTDESETNDDQPIDESAKIISLQNKIESNLIEYMTNVRKFL